MHPVGQLINENPQFRSVNPDRVGRGYTTYVLANVWKDIKLGVGISPYLGGELGMAFVDIDTNLCAPGLCLAQGKNVALAGQAGVGLRVDVANNVTLDLGYRTKVALDILTDESPFARHSMGSYYNHEVQAGASLSF